MSLAESDPRRPLQVLMLEDNATDAELIVRELRRAGYDLQWRRVETSADFLAAITTAPDLIISDFSLPGYDGLAALEQLRESGLNIPFIIVSGTLGEDAAVAAMREGATDFLIKDRLQRLPAAVARALNEKRLRDDRREHEAKIARLSRIRAVIGGISSAMLRLHDADALLREACRVAAIHGVFPLAWVATVDPQTQELVVSATHSLDAQAGERIYQALRAVPKTQRPAQWVLDHGHRAVINDFSSAVEMGELAGWLQNDGFLSVAAFPLRIAGRVVAVFALLARERNFFDDEEIELLEWLCADLSYALESIDNAARLDRLAYFDALTGLCNASLFQDRVNQLIHLARQNHETACVVVLDLEAFTLINDSMGRAVGDQVLRLVGQRLREFLTEASALGRIGSDTFAAASTGTSEIVATALRDRVFDALKQPLVIDGHTVRVGAQAGIALYPADGDDGRSLFRNAEDALKHAKAAKNAVVPYAYYSPVLHNRLLARSRLQEQLCRALEEQQFELHYQARVDIVSGEIVGGEALIRWRDPQRGLIGPDEFIGLAEECGLIVPIGAWVIDTVCAQQAAWMAARIETVPIAVNLSSVQFEKGDLEQTVRDALQRHALPAHRLGLELTESAVVKDPVVAASALRALRLLGVSLALDDFGTGHSSLAHLRHFPFNSVKIDRSFVTDITSNPDAAAIANAVIAMAHHLNLKVVAEGVETQGQFRALRAHGCDEMQGFMFGQALPAADFAAQLLARKRMSLPSEAPADQRTLLIVDDEASVCAALTRMLRRDGYRILRAANGAEGLQLLAENAVQVIISDQRMPGMSGTDFLSAVSQLYPETVRLILSGYTDLAVVTDSVNRGAVYKFLTKPWHDETLREQIREAFRRYRGARQGSAQ